MAFSPASQQSPDDKAIWDSLKAAISASYGFQRWQIERAAESTLNLEQQVRRYLRETLETLAY